MARASFVSPPPIRRLRDLTCYRIDLVNTRTGEKTRVEKLLELACIKLSSSAGRGSWRDLVFPTTPATSPAARWTRAMTVAHLVRDARFAGEVPTTTVGRVALAAAHDPRRRGGRRHPGPLARGAVRRIR